MSHWFAATSVGVGLVASNYFYQGFMTAEPDWWVAWERSFFQVVALLAYGTSLSIYKQVKKLDEQGGW